MAAGIAEACRSAALQPKTWLWGIAGLTRALLDSWLSRKESVCGDRDMRESDLCKSMRYTVSCRLGKRNSNRGCRVSMCAAAGRDKQGRIRARSW